MPVTRTVDEVYPERWLKADDIPNDGDLILTIMDVNEEALGEKKEMKLVLVFRETTKNLATECDQCEGSDRFIRQGPQPMDWQAHCPVCNRGAVWGQNNVGCSCSIAPSSRTTAPETGTGCIRINGD